MKNTPTKNRKRLHLAAQGVYEGKYRYAVLERGSSSFELLPDPGEQLQVIWCTNISTRDT